MESEKDRYGEKRIMADRTEWLKWLMADHIERKRRNQAEVKSILLIGVNHLGTLIAKSMEEIGYEVMAVDSDENRINAIQSYVTDAQIGDSTNEEFLKSLGVSDYDLCFVTIASDFQNSLMTTFLLKELGAARVIGRANSEIQEKLLLRSGADEVINPEKQAAAWIAEKYGNG